MAEIDLSKLGDSLDTFLGEGGNDDLLHQIIENWWNNKVYPEIEHQRQRALAYLTDDQIDHYVKCDMESTREDLIRLTKTETVLNQQVIPQLNQLTEVVLDPKEGLAVLAGQNARSLSAIRDDMEVLKQMREFADLGMQLIGWAKKPFFKWMILIMLGSMGFSSVKFLSTSISDFVDYQMQQHP